MNRIFLIGYMGSGKTTIGKLLASRLGYSFVDMDAYIEEKQFKTISQFFAEKGEHEFRALEQKCLHEIAEFENVIISTGGGTPCFFNNMEYMNSRGLTIYLKLTAAELAERLELIGVSKRPLLANRTGEDLRSFIDDGLSKREPFYEKANHSFSGDIGETVDNICELLSQL
ncbi:MAG: shikimate kinase [Paludibacter sp.]